MIQNICSPCGSVAKQSRVSWNNMNSFLRGNPNILPLSMYFISSIVLYSLKGHSQLWDRADLDTSFLTLKRVHLNLKSKLRVEYIEKSASIFAVFCSIFNLKLKNLFLSVFLLILGYYFIIFG